MRIEVTRRRDDDGDEQRQRRDDDDSTTTAKTPRRPHRRSSPPALLQLQGPRSRCPPNSHSRCKPPQPLAVAAAASLVPTVAAAQLQSLPSVAAAPGTLSRCSFLALTVPALLPLLTSHLDNGAGQRARRDDDAARVGGRPGAS